MTLYLSIIGCAMLIIASINVTLDTASAYYVIAAVIWCTVLQFLLDGIIALVINNMPDRWFGVDNPLFKITEREKRLYKRLKVRLWKDKVWELGGLGGFSKKTIKEPKNPGYIEKFIIECSKGVVVHRLSYPVGYLAMLTTTKLCSFTIALPVASVNLFLNILPTIVLRHNTAKLKSMLRLVSRNKPVKQEA